MALFEKALVILGGAGLLFAGGVMMGSRSRSDTASELADKYRVQQIVNDSTVALLATERLRTGVLTSQLEAAKQMKGKLVSAFDLHLKQDDARGTLHPAVTIGTPVALPPDSQHLEFVDTAAWGHLGVQLDVNWPKREARAGYTIGFAPQEVHVGFVQIGDRTVAVVSCEHCKEAQIETPYAQPIIKVPPRLTRWAGAQWNVATGRWTANLGLDYRLFGGVSVQAQGSQTFEPGQIPQLNLGFYRTF